MFALVDCNNFYASCERVFRPDLNGKPIVVLSNNDGCVIARSNEAKAFGIPMGAPAFKHKALFKKHNVYVFSTNFALYGDMSTRVMNVLSSFCPDMEVYSIDEAFLKLEGFDRFDLTEYGLKIVKTITKNTGIPVSMGIAPTKSLAKVANRIAKKFPKETNGVYKIDSAESIEKALKWLAVGDVWGIGRQHAKRLNNIGVNTAYQFAQLSNEWVLKNLSVVGLRLQNELNGKPNLQLEIANPKKSIATTRTFEKMYTTLEEVDERISTFTVVCAEKLRRQNSVCSMIMLFVHSNSHRKDLKQYSKNIILKTAYPTNSSMELLKYARAGLKKIFKAGYYYKKAGVIVMGITPENERQLSCFEVENQRDGKLLSVMDNINRSIGQDKVKFGCQLLDKTWKMKQENLSPRYTTKLSEIITINV